MKPPVKPLLAALLTLSSAGSLQPQTAADQPAGASPLLVSPGGRGREGLVGTGCPTFSWADTPQASGYTLIVYEVASSQGGESPREPLLRAEFPAGVSSWTPDLSECLLPGRYGWAVAAVPQVAGAEKVLRWSKPAVFRVEAAPEDRLDRERPERSAVALDGAATVTVPESVFHPGEAPGGSPFHSITGAAIFLPPGCAAGSEKFLDVPASSPYCRWVEQIARDGVINGCGGGRYCPGQPVTREQLAVFLTRAMRGTLDFAPAPGGARTTTVDDPATSGVGEYTSIANGADGLPVISYFANGTNALTVAHCNDIACVGADETITTVDNPANIVGLYTSIAIGADGLPIISYNDSVAMNLKVAHCNDVACAPGGEVITTVDGSTNNVGSYTSIAIGADGLPIISYYDLTAGTLKVAHCNDLACAGMNETISTVDDPPTNSVGSHTSIAIGTDGLPIISYQDNSAANLKVAHCSDVACAGATTTTVDDSAATVGSSTSLAIGVDGLPVISYVDLTNDTLKVAHCNDLACLGVNETITVVDAAAHAVGFQTSIAIGADQLPVISYLDGVAIALKVAHCNDVACAGSNETITVVDDHPNGVGRYSSLAIGTDGVPIISYFDETGGLKVLHCGTSSCTQ